MSHGMDEYGRYEDAEPEFSTFADESRCHECKSYEKEVVRLCDELKRLRAVLAPFANKSAGERPGDTLLRVADDVSVRHKERGVENEDWCEQLRDFGRLMNKAAETTEK